MALIQVDHKTDLKVSKKKNIRRKNLVLTEKVCLSITTAHSKKCLANGLTIYSIF